MLLAAAELQGVSGRSASLVWTRSESVVGSPNREIMAGERACTAQKMITMTTDHSRGLR